MIGVPNLDEFSENFQRGVGVISDPTNYVSDLSRNFVANPKHYLLVMEGWLMAAGAFCISCLLIFGILKRTPPSAPEGFHVIVVGAGPGGIAMGKRLNDLGIRCFFKDAYASLASLPQANNWVQRRQQIIRLRIVQFNKKIGRVGV